MTHGKPCVKMYVLLRHMASHVSTFNGFELCINRGVHNQFMAEENGRKGEKGERRKERKERKRKRKRERGRRPVVSSSVHWRSSNQNLLNQGVKSGDSTRGYASRGRNSSYFGLLIAFGLLFLG